MNTRATALLVGVAVIAVLAVTTVQRARTHDASVSANVAIAGADAGASAGVVAPASRDAQAKPQGVVPGVPTSRMVVAYRLDPSLTSGLFMGDRWVTPERYAFAQQGTRFVVQAKMQAIDDVGSDPLDLSGNWSTQDPEMIALTREQDGVVTIEVRQPGTGTLVASAGGETKRLQVTARQLPDAMEVAIVQPSR